MPVLIEETTGTVTVVTEQVSAVVIPSEGIQGPPGPIGPQGEIGPVGTGLTLLGTLANTGELPASGTVGDGYLINGDLWVYDGSTWNDVGQIQGPQGEAGPAGADGPQGPQGPAGTDGPQGPAGADSTVPGPTGPTGPAGDTGPAGPAGADSTVPGPEGPAGPAGATGDDGDSAYEVAVAEGFVGTEAAWLASLEGPQGPQGIQGIQGEDGPQGIQGIQGETGPEGPQGIEGPQGPVGEDGAVEAYISPTEPVSPESGDVWLDTSTTLELASLYDLAVANGFVGTEQDYLDSLVGEKGDTGTVINSQSGGDNGKVVRVSAADTWTNAANTDTPAQLTFLAFKQTDTYYGSGTLISGLSGLTAGTVYFLSTEGDLTSTAPTPSSTVTSVLVGVALSTTSLYFNPNVPVGG